MRPGLARMLTRLYPGRWCDRYGAEFEEILRTTPGSAKTLVDVIRVALAERIFGSRGDSMGEPVNDLTDQLSPNFGTIVRKPSALLPMAMSLTALTILVVHLALYGVAREADEGTTAHLWQILMAGQLPVLAFFAIRWLPRAPGRAMCVLGLQAGAALASMAPVFYFNL